MTNFKDAPIDDIVAEYISGMTIDAIGAAHRIPPRTIHSWLVRVGVPRRKCGTPKGYKFSEERNRKISEKHKGFRMTAEQRKRISEAR